MNSLPVIKFLALRPGDLDFLAAAPTIFPIMSGRIIYGVKAVGEALYAGGRVNRIYFAKESRAHGVGELLRAAKATRVPFDMVPQAKLNELTGTREHQGVAAAISPVEYVSMQRLLSSCPDRAILLVLDQVQHPRNLGMLLRTAACAGAMGVILTARGGALMDDEVLRASAGAVFHVPIAIAGNAAQTVRDLKKHGFWSYALDAKAGDSVFTIRWADRCALVLGNETKGLRPTVYNACDAAVRIPLARDFDSLNVAVAGAIVLYQAAESHGLN
ncbi:MAG: 23S rRNA (guanosine(2251)-2'-O)-methyltransferase RlmB [Candidatus Hydrogenedentota bacterium]